MLDQVFHYRLPDHAGVLARLDLRGCKKDQRKIILTV